MNENKPSEEDDASNKMNKTMARVLFDHESRHVWVCVGERECVNIASYVSRYNL